MDPHGVADIGHDQGVQRGCGQLTRQRRIYRDDTRMKVKRHRHGGGDLGPQSGAGGHGRGSVGDSGGEDIGGGA